MKGGICQNGAKVGKIRTLLAKSAIVYDDRNIYHCQWGMGQVKRKKIKQARTKMAKQAKVLTDKELSKLFLYDQ